MSDIDFNALLLLISKTIDVNELSDLKLLCKGKIAEDSDVNSVWNLLRELEKKNNLGPDKLGVLKDLLKYVDDVDGREQLLFCVKEFEGERKERRIGIVPSLKHVAGKIVDGLGSYTKSAGNMIGAVTMQCTFRGSAGIMVVVSAVRVIYNSQTLKDFMDTFSNCVLPAANFLRKIAENCLLFTVQAETLSALETLWKEYQDGTLQKRLQQFLVTEELKKLTGEEDLKVIVNIDDQEYKDACLDLLISVAQASNIDDDKQPQERCRRKSDSDLCVKPVETDVTYLRLQQAEDRLLCLEREKREQLESEIKNETAETIDADVEGDDVMVVAETTDKKSGHFRRLENSSEQLNYFRMCFIAFNLIPEGLRIIFKQEWDSRYEIFLGEWEDTPRNGLVFYNHESGESRMRNARFLMTMQNGNTGEWGTDMLTFALLTSDCIGSTLGPAIHKDVDDLRQVRNELAHFSKAGLTDGEFQNYVGRVLNAFTSLGLPIDDIEAVKNQISFPTPEVKAVTIELKGPQVALHSVKEEHGVLTQALYSKVEPFCNLPFKPSHQIITRSSDIKRIVTKMKEIEVGSQRAVSTIHLSGNPGCGKSQLARQLGQEFFTSRSRERSRSHERSIAFVGTLNAETLQTLGDSYILLAKQLGISGDALTILAIAITERPKETINHLKELILPAIRKFSTWLIIADNVVDLPLIHNFLPQTSSEEWGHGQVLITTQDSSSIPTSASHTYHESLSKGMLPDDAIELLKQVSQIVDQEQTEKVAQVLEYQPLALAAAALYAQTVISGGSPKYNWSEYLELIGQSKHRLTEKPLITMATSIKVAMNKAFETDDILHLAFILFLLCASESLPIQAVLNFVEDRTIQTEEKIKERLLKSSSFLCFFEEDGAPEYLRLHSIVFQVLKTEAIF